MSIQQRVGKKGEQAVHDYFVQQGYTVLARNLHTRHGELDVVVTKAGLTRVVEVKTRRGALHGFASESLSHKKFAKMRYALYEARQNGLRTPGRVQFDLAAVQITGTTAHITLFENIGLD